jgi:serine protease Do
VIIDSDGYILTNAHVIVDAQRIRVSLFPAEPTNSAAPDQTITDALAQNLSPMKEATLVGVFKEADLALIKIQATGLPTLPMAEYRNLRAGQVVFAFGSREGLANSVSMGVISSVARQPDRDSPFIYIQTDAPINPGDSGGPLVNTAGEVVGLDTFILTQSGGNEGLGFAIPSPMLQFVSAQLRKYGHVHRPLIGVGMQTITPVLTRALNLARASGLLVSDVLPGSPAEAAGIRLNDIILEVDGKQVPNLPLFLTTTLVHPEGDPIRMRVLRDGAVLDLSLPCVEESHSMDSLSTLIDGDKALVRELGILAIDMTERTAPLFSGLRGKYGVMVAARSAETTVNSGLQTGDAIHELNGTLVTNVDALRKRLGELKRGEAAALLIEREGKSMYVGLEID